MYRGCLGHGAALHILIAPILDAESRIEAATLSNNDLLLVELQSNFISLWSLELAPGLSFNGPIRETASVAVIDGCTNLMANAKQMAWSVARSHRFRLVSLLPSLRQHFLGEAKRLLLIVLMY